jgi:glyoxylate/hydroxypyruvate reductase A
MDLRLSDSSANIRIGLLGLGELGVKVALECARLRFAVNGWSRRSTPIEGVECHTGADALADFLSGSDIRVNWLPATCHSSGSADAFIPPGGKLLHQCWP